MNDVALNHGNREGVPRLVFGYAYPAYECSKTVERNKPEMEQLFFWCQYWYGTSYVYNSFFQPYVAKHEVEIDHTLLELRVKAGDIAILHWQKGCEFWPNKYVSSQLASQFESDKLHQHQLNDNRAKWQREFNE
ncbi:hva22-like protein h [Quercus suber]|uniref:Hva22-like protein h n=1 Tax=Quercus suber TaxID=58331 RepID=A0AAW0LUE0_QUESU